MSIGDAALVAVGAEKDGAEARRRKWRPAARFVALADGLDLDDVGAEIAEILGAQRTRQDFRQVEDADAGSGVLTLPVLSIEVATAIAELFKVGVNQAPGSAEREAPATIGGKPCFVTSR